MSDFTPWQCPHATCPSRPADGPIFRHRKRGHYSRGCDGKRVQRYQCLVCRRRFSRQSFRNDHRHRRPELNVPILNALDSKVTQRQIARTLKCNRKTVARRMPLFGAHFKAAHLREIAKAKLKGPFVFDELETYEQNRIEKPVTVAVIVDKDTGFMVYGACGTLPSRDRKRGNRERKSQSRKVVKACLDVIAAHRDPDCALIFYSDEKATYPKLIREAVGDKVLHVRISGKAKRDTENPLFRINHNFAMMRDGMSRLVRRNWGYSKRIERKEDHMWIYHAYKNYIRPYTNKDRKPSAASKLGVSPRRYSLAEAIAWKGRFSLD